MSERVSDSRAAAASAAKFRSPLEKLAAARSQYPAAASVADMAKQAPRTPGGHSATSIVLASSLAVEELVFQFTAIHHVWASEDDDAKEEKEAALRDAILTSMRRNVACVRVLRGLVRLLSLVPKELTEVLENACDQGSEARHRVAELCIESELITGQQGMPIPPMTQTARKRARAKAAREAKEAKDATEPKEAKDARAKAKASAKGPAKKKATKTEDAPASSVPSPTQEQSAQPAQKPQPQPQKRPATAAATDQEGAARAKKHRVTAATVVREPEGDSDEDGKASKIPEAKVSKKPPQQQQQPKKDDGSSKASDSKAKPAAKGFGGGAIIKGLVAKKQTIRPERLPLTLSAMPESEPSTVPPLSPTSMRMQPRSAAAAAAIAAAAAFVGPLLPEKAPAKAAANENPKNPEEWEDLFTDAQRKSDELKAGYKGLVDRLADKDRVIDLRGDEADDADADEDEDEDYVEEDAPDQAD